jgi:hypothetical protein
VVVGDLIGSGASQEQAIVGETPNLAARLQGVAEPNSVVIADNTRKLVGRLFEFEDLGPKDLKGISGPVQAWAAVRPSSVESRFDVRLRRRRAADPLHCTAASSVDNARQIRDQHFLKTHRGETPKGRKFTPD